MNSVVVPAVISVFLGTGLLAWLLFVGAPAGRRKVLANLNRDLEAAPDLHAAGEQAASELADVLRRRTPPMLLKSISKLWASAGRPEAWPIDRILTMKLLGGLAGFVIMLGFILMLRDMRGFLMGAALTAALFFLPEILLYNTGIKRKQAINLQLPDTLDQMSIAVNAGLGFDAAMQRVAKNGRGELASELVRTLQDIQVGMTRRDAYFDLAERTGVPKLERFVRAVVQGETYGIALADVLQSQAEELRMERRQDAERRAMQIPVKVIFPVILFIMPALFIVVIGPGVIQIMKSIPGF
ncbi:type II secretion system F family protein [Propionicimonas sp.]|uniref:type II secretion system F family protein n=1 Tax=Propionicimonas sp. TaxID=1955623 RepID=UPI00180DF013|nr:type II secretion system F family protein [Propionicimonas sp.]MBU3975801.1 type II secretion system F family protein [Actinomycetota bacterium]MBA3022210.1 type II secretion system F family protein [Propionicimonas sp.]MBU3987351.1 type II secretion system F family protein [Actinomycetota bacterium]MBU4006430.1 type II secretion system F family protein [Actinomycetota bacterium]MBU4065309.1 type II secretion system F family protein [Actinomycetota bacterium]